MNVKLLENLLNLSKIYCKMMFNHDLVYVRPLTFNNVEMALLEFCKVTQRL